MTLNKAVAKKSNEAVSGQHRNRALDLLLEDMAVWYPAPYFDIEMMVSKETKGFKLNQASI